MNSNTGSGPAGTGGTGGGGAGSKGSPTGTNGTSNLGGGGGGADHPTYTTGTGNGGSGVVILRYLDSNPAATSTTGSPTVTTNGGYRIYQYTSSGSFTF
jgi:hypothetical protein